jgi:hypothetical protein
MIPRRSCKSPRIAPSENQREKAKTIKAIRNGAKDKSSLLLWPLPVFSAFNIAQIRSARFSAARHFLQIRPLLVCNPPSVVL